MSKTVITFGTFDVFHIGHLKILKRAAAFGDELIVGISTDQLNWDKKQKKQYAISINEWRLSAQ
jgi:glycerol-3-phosphate cytidylyltransferase